MTGLHTLFWLLSWLASLFYGPFRFSHFFGSLISSSALRVHLGSGSRLDRLHTPLVLYVAGFALSRSFPLPALFWLGVYFLQLSARPPLHSFGFSSCWIQSFTVPSATSYLKQPQGFTFRAGQNSFGSGSPNTYTHSLVLFPSRLGASVAFTLFWLAFLAIPFMNRDKSHLDTIRYDHARFFPWQTNRHTLSPGFHLRL